MAAQHSKFQFSGEMFEQAMEADAWKPLPGSATEQVEASQQLGELARNVASYAETPMAVPPDPIVHEPVPTPIAAAPATAEQETPAPVELPRPIAVWRLERPGDLFAVLRRDCPTAYLEQFQLLRTQLLLMRAQCGTGAELRCVCMTSANKGEGKTFSARNLAATLTVASGKKVLLIETGAREPSVPPTVLGLDSALADTDRWYDCVAELATSGLSILTGFRMGQNGDFEPLPKLIDALRPHYDWIVIDAPAIHDAASAEWVVAAADVAMLVVREGQTSFDNLGDAIARIPPGRLAGVVMNKIAPVRKKSWLPKLPKVRIKWTKGNYS